MMNNMFATNDIAQGFGIVNLLFAPATRHADVLCLSGQPEGVSLNGGNTNINKDIILNKP